MYQTTWGIGIGRRAGRCRWGVLAVPGTAATVTTDRTQQTPAQQLIGDFAPILVALTDDVLFGDVWAGPELSPRDRKDGDTTGPASYARRRLANRFDLSLPENQRKLDAADKLTQLADDAGISLIAMAIAFVLRHPAVTAPIIGPRTMEHLESQLAQWMWC